MDRQKDHCNVIQRLFPNGGCAWSTQDQYFVKSRYGAFGDPEDAKKYSLWFTAARALRLGYNVLAIDVDVTIHQDVYRIFKSPPFDTMNMIYQHEDLPRINVGVLYFQNVSAVGPVAYIVAGEMIQTFRYMDDVTWVTDVVAKEGFLPEAPSVDEQLYFISWEQLLMSSLFGSVMRGVPYVDDVLLAKTRTPTPPKYPLQTKKATVLHYTANGSEREYSILYSFLDAPVPHPSVELVAQQGGLAYPLVKGGLADKMIAFFEQESGPLWPEPYEFINNASIPPVIERIGTPHTNVIGYYYDYIYRNEWYGVVPPGCAICHTVPIRQGKIMRLALWKAMGWWHWRVDDLLFQKAGIRPGPLIQYGGTHNAATAAPSPPSPPPLLVLSPLVTLRYQTRKEWQLGMMHFATTAALLGRIPVLPPIHCLSPFLQSGTTRDVVDVDNTMEEIRTWGRNMTLDFNDHGILPVVDDVYTEERNMCFPWGMIPDSCVTQGHIVLYWDYVQQLRMQQQKQRQLSLLQQHGHTTIQETERNTLFYSDDDDGMATPSSPLGVGSEQRKKTVDQVIEQGEKFDHQSVPVLFIRSPIALLRGEVIGEEVEKKVEMIIQHHAWCIGSFVGIYSEEGASYRDVFMESLIAS